MEGKKEASANCSPLDASENGRKDLSNGNTKEKRFLQSVKPKPRIPLNAKVPIFKGNNSQNKDMESKISVSARSKLFRLDANSNLTSSRNKATNEKRFPVPNQHRGNRTNFKTTSKLKTTENSKIPLRFLDDLITKRPNEIVMTILPKNNMVRSILDKEVIDHDVMSRLLQTLGKAVTSSMHQNVNQLVHTIGMYKHFLSSHVPKYLVSFLQTGMTVDKSFDQGFCQSLEGLTDFLHKFQLSMPSTASESTLVLVPLMETICKTFLSKNEKLCLSLSRKIKELDDENQNFLKEYAPSEAKHVSANEKLQLLSPPENFRSISTLPTLDDIHLPCPFLRPNLITGQYVDAEHYLDVQFRLLREDYIKPLRDGINDYLSLKESGQSLKSLRDIKVYTDVQIVDKDYDEGGFVHIAYFESKEFAKIKWEYSKRFLSGSLLCLSDDNFKTVYFASVAKRDPKMLKMGFLPLTFEPLTNEVLNLNSSRCFVVIETSAYFVAYRHNLDALANLDENKLAMKPYILEVKKHVDKPSYLKDDSCYDIRPLLLPLNGSHIIHSKDGEGKCNTSYEFPRHISSNTKRIPILQDKYWPPPTELNLDPSQHAAIIAAVTKEFVVIQGPPGTGKTYVGLRIAQLLLHNIQVVEDPTPILVVCYTNHALDQFLEGLLSFTKDIVRVGGRSSNEAIEEFQLNSLRRAFSFQKRFPKIIVSNLREIRSRLKHMKATLDETKMWILKCRSTVMGEEVLMNHIDKPHYFSLKSFSRLLHDDGMMIRDWLNTRVRVKNEFSLLLPEIPNRFLSDPVEECNVPPDNPTVATESEEHVDSEGEADVEYIEAQREVNAEEFAHINYSLASKQTKLDLGPSDQDGWQTQGGKKRRNCYVNHCFKSSKAMSKAEAKGIRNVWELPLIQRWRLYKLWLESYIKEKNGEVLRIQIQMKNEHQVLCELRKEEDVYVCQQSRFVGMTTTGAAKNRDLVQQLNPKIVIVEEAAEILESHIVTSLAPGTKHLILIGDHQQLRPNPTVHMLAVKFGLNISLFERMLKNGMQCYKLGIQHRMRPEISALLVPHIYKDLQNHDSVYKYENIKGIGKNVYFLTHSFKELQEYDSKSRVNQHEAKFMAQLCRYVLLQGYEPSQITVLTTYSGQLFALKKEMYKLKETEGVKITVVDNYQGEENDIILISFVRSNSEGNIGFLKISNRVCVALSRAKKGLFCIGNFELLAEKSDLWKNIIETLKENEAIGPTLMLKCQNHPDVSNAVGSEKDFGSVPEGGCNRDCEFRLSCGHACTLKCHPYDPEHEKVECHKQCIKKCINGHLCQKLCYQECGNCYTLVDKTVEECGHTTQVFCYCKDEAAVCPELCNIYLTCRYNEGDVKGVLKNVFFIDLDLENLKELNTYSAINKYIVSFLIKYFKYLIQQGYNASQITILTTDLMQFNTLKKETEGNTFYSGLKCILAGKEDVVITGNDLMLAGFAHSKIQEKIPFLESSNQVFIALSQATKGIFCIGQFDLFAEKYDYWKNLTTALKEKGAISPHLYLQCQNHPETNVQIKSREYFDLVPEGGCTVQCEVFLSCGHRCSLKCHPYDMAHNSVKCHEPCSKKCNYGHLCSKKCSTECGDCEFRIDKELKCGHIENIICGHQNEEISCSQLCEIYLPCGHMCASKCGDPCGECSENIKIKSALCSHKVVVKCSEWDNEDMLQKSCQAPCGIMLSCGHLCQGTCGKCHQGRLHVACKSHCQRLLLCGHQCYALCYESCPPCMQPCENKCVHNVCTKTCGEPCDKCSKPCEWLCNHFKCNSPCSDNNSTHSLCYDSCSKLLKCGHKCIGLCGQPCPEDCRTCDEDKGKFIFFGSENVLNRKYILLEDCKHIFDVHLLLQWMSENNKAIQLKSCPKCKTIIRYNHHFEKIIRTSVKNMNAVKKVICNNTYCDKTKNQVKRAIEYIGNSEIKMELLSAVISRKNIKELLILENVVRILIKNKVLTDSFIGYSAKPMSCVSNVTEKLRSYISMTKKWLIKFIVYECITASELQLQELVWEAHRLTLAYKIWKELNSNCFNSSEDLKKLGENLITFAPFREEDAKKFYIKCENLKSIELSPDATKLPLLKTLSSARNTWFQCANSHMYSVMQNFCLKQENTCYECDETSFFSDIDSDMDGSEGFDSDSYLSNSDYEFGY